MNDIKYTLLTDTRAKKSVAASARRRVSRGGKCVNMPHDHMTKKEMQKMNSEIREYNLGKPMGWELFKSGPLDLQAEYLQRCYQRGGTLSSIAKMFGVAPSTVCFWCKRNGIKSGATGRRIPLAEFLKWANIDHLDEPAEEPKVEPAAPVKETPMWTPVAPVEEKTEEKTEDVFRAESGSVTMVATPKEVMDFLALVCGNERSRISVSWG